MPSFMSVFYSPPSGGFHEVVLHESSKKEAIRQASGLEHQSTTTSHTDTSEIFQTIVEEPRGA